MSLDKLKVLMAEVFETTPDQVNEHMSMEATDIWDSLKHMELMIGIEEQFQIELEAEEMMEMVSFSSIVKVLAAKGVI